MITKLKGIVFAAILLLVLAGCVTPTPTSTRIYTLPELKYRLFAEFDVFWVNPYLWPVVREDQEKQEAIVQYPAIRADDTEFRAILAYLSLSDKAKYTDEEKLLIFRQHQKLALAVQMTASTSGYSFVIREGEGAGWKYEGMIDAAGRIKITKKETSFNSYPICLAIGTLIDTPSGQIPVEELAAGMPVWSPDENGKRIQVSIIKTSRADVPTNFEVITLLLKDGRSISASPQHPSASGIALAEYRVGDMLDGSVIISSTLILYQGGFTFDLLPDGDTACYWANGILLRSTLVE